MEDPDDPRLVEYFGLRDHELRQRRERPGGDMAGLFVAEGDAVIERAIAAGHRPRSVLVDAARRRALPAAVPDDVPVYVISPQVVSKVSGYPKHRESLASFDRRPLPTPAEVVAGARGLVALERVVNPTNVGVITRSAAALGADGMLLDPTCCDPVYRRASRVSMGECFSLPYAWAAPFPAGLDVARRAGFLVVALTPAPDAVAVDELGLAPGARVVLLLGTEGPGLSEPSLEAADVRARIPLRRGVDSLNVGAAAAVACYEVLSRRR